MADKPGLRYYFTGAPVGNLSRYWSAFLVVSSLVIMALLRTPSAFVLFGIFALGGLYGLLRPAQPGLFVEVGEEQLLINGLTQRKIDYRKIASADFYSRKEGDIVRSILNLAMLVDSLFGGRRPVGKPGQLDEGAVELRYVRPLWVYIPFPPFLLRRRSWLLRVDNAASLLADINRRLSALERNETRNLNGV